VKYSYVNLDHSQLMKSRLTKLLYFFNFVICLKKVRRSGWMFKAGISSAESVADHSFSLSVMAMVFSDLKGLNTERAVKMAIIHDLAESITGDIMPDKISHSAKKILENKAMVSILKELPKSLRIEYSQIWNEYVTERSDLSKLVHRLDKLEMILQAREYMSSGYSTGKLVEFTRSEDRIVNNDRNDIISELLQGLKAASNQEY
jgi:putative hydrolases of HD superfamily